MKSLVSAALTLALALALAAQLPPLVLVSTGRDGTPSDVESHRPSISGDGRFVAFESYASNLVNGDTNDEKVGYLSGAPGRVGSASAGATDRSCRAPQSAGQSGIKRAPYSGRMVLSRKRGGSRRLTHLGQRYAWHIGRAISAACSTLSVRTLEARFTRLVVDLPEYTDLWLESSGVQVRISPPVGPKLVARIVEAALQAGWRPHEGGQDVRGQWRDGAGLRLEPF